MQIKHQADVIVTVVVVSIFFNRYIYEAVSCSNCTILCRLRIQNSCTNLSVAIELERTMGRIILASIQYRKKKKTSQTHPAYHTTTDTYLEHTHNYATCCCIKIMELFSLFFESILFSEGKEKEVTNKEYLFIIYFNRKSSSSSSYLL